MDNKKSNMELWAEEEIEIACKREKANSEDDDWDYGCSCYESALKAFRSLLGDGHSGMSIGFTKNILNRLIAGKPLTPIEDTDDVWNHIADTSGLRGEETNYQCKRQSSLFKYVYSDGSVKYRDINRYYCFEIDDHDNTYQTGLVSDIIHEMFPITMPYSSPTTRIKVCTETFLTDVENGDFDTKGVLYAIMPDGERIEINRFFAEADNDTGWREINIFEYHNRKEKRVERRNNG